MPPHRVRRLVQFIFAFLILTYFLLPQPLVFAAAVTLAWDSNSPAPDGYLVYMRAEGQSYNYSRAAWRGPQNSCTLEDLKADVTYYFVVRAYVGNDVSGDSNEISFQSDVSHTQSSLNNSTQTSSTQTSSTQTNTTPSSSSNTNEFQIVASAGDNGTINPSGDLTLSQGNNQTFRINAKTGYHIADLFVDGKSIGPVASYTFTQIDANHTINATFAIDTYTLSASCTGGGSISPRGETQANYGGSLSYSIIPNSGYHIENVLVDGTCVGTPSVYTFADIDEDHAIQATFTKANEPPVSDAGPDQTVTEGDQVTLSGLNSIDLDDGIAKFFWRQTKGPKVTLNSAQEAQTRFTAPNVDEAGQVLVFELVVTDYSGVTSVDSCIVNITWVNTPPIAKAGEDQTVYAGESVQLDATASSDSDNRITAYHWIQRQGPKVNLADAEASITTFEAPEVDIGGTSLVFELTVTDEAGLQDSDTCVVRVAWNNEPPAADAGPDQDAITGDEVTLDGSGSTDSDDGIHGYLWKQTDGPPVTLSDTTAVQPVFTAPTVASNEELLVFDLVVTDYNGLQSADSCQVFVAPAALEDEDRQPPQIAITDPNSSYWYTTDYSIKLKGTVTDNVEVDRVVWSNHRGYSGQAKISGDYWVINALRLKTWFNVITVTAYDTNGNEHSASLLVFVRYNR